MKRQRASRNSQQREYPSQVPFHMMAVQLLHPESPAELNLIPTGNLCKIWSRKYCLLPKIIDYTENNSTKIKTVYSM